MLRINGGEGLIGDHYLVIFSVEELIPFNQEYEVDEYASEVFLFGSDGAGEGTLWSESASTVIVKAPFIGMSI